VQFRNNYAVRYAGDVGNNDLYAISLKLKPGRYEFVFIAQGSNDYFATSMGMNYRVEVAPRTDGNVCGVELEKVEVYDGEGRLLAVYTGDGSAYVGDTLRVYYKVCSNGAVYVASSISIHAPRRQRAVGRDLRLSNAYRQRRVRRLL